MAVKNSSLCKAVDKSFRFASGQSHSDVGPNDNSIHSSVLPGDGGRLAEMGAFDDFDDAGVNGGVPDKEEFALVPSCCFCAIPKSVNRPEQFNRKRKGEGVKPGLSQVRRTGDVEDGANSTAVVAIDCTVKSQCSLT